MVVYGVIVWVWCGNGDLGLLIWAMWSGMVGMDGGMDGGMGGGGMGVVVCGVVV